MMSPLHQYRTVLLIGALVAVNVAGAYLAHAAREDELLKGIDPKAVERTADSLTFSKDHLKSLFQKDAMSAIGDTGVIASKGEEIDAARVQEVLNHELKDTDLLKSTPSDLIGKLSSIQERMEIQSEISQRTSIASFESAVMDKQTQTISDKTESLSEQRKKLTEKYKDLLSAADEASSYVNNLPPM